jgi:uncharacterized protein involved in outer membrane biogenesis
MLRKSHKLLLLALGILLVLVGVYALLGYRYAPGFVREQAVAWVREAYGRELQLGNIRTDPFRLQLEVSDVRLPDADGQEMLGLRRAFIDLQLSSLWRRAWVFRAVELDQPDIRAVVRQDGTLNLVDLANPRNAAPPPPEPEPPPRLWIQSLQVREGEVDYLVADRAEPLVKRIAPIAFALEDFRTTAEGGQFFLTASTAAAERFEWRGHFALTPSVTSTGQISIAGLQLTTLAGLLPEALPMAVNAGSIDLSGDYGLTLDEEPDFTLRLPNFSISGPAIGRRGARQNSIDATRVGLDGMEFDLAARTLRAPLLSVDGLTVRGSLDGQRQLDLMELMGEPGATESGAATTPSTNEGQAPPDWKVGVDAVQVRAARVELEDRGIAERPHFRLDPLDVSTGPVSLDLAQPIEVKLAARMNDAARIEIEGRVAPQPLDAEVKIGLQDAPLAMLQPYILPVADLTIRSGTIGTRGQLTVATRKPEQPPVIGFDGDVTLQRLHSVDNTLGEDLLNLRRVQVSRMRYRSEPASLNIERIVAQEPYARVVISREQILNISAVFDPEGAAAQRAAFLAAEQGEAVPERKETRAERRRREKAEKAAKEERAAQAAAEAALPDPPETFPVRIGEVRVENGRMNFSDFNIQPNFSAEILDLTGSISRLSSAHSSRASVELAGNVGEFSPVAIEGSVQPFAFDRFTDIGLKFENIALPVFNPYSGAFAGYNIAKGSLTTDLRYQIEQRKLQADHHIRIDQLEWGDAAENKGEATLPVKFATVLLRDRHGVINLDVPVSGSLDDPQLRVGPIVWQIIKNIIVKAATAPFALLGALFSGAEDAQFVDFQPGDATLDPAAAERLAQLARSLAEKPGIALDIPLGAVAELDRPALQERRFQQALQEAAGGSVGEDAEGPAYASLTAAQKREALSGWYRTRKRPLPAIPPPPAPPEGTSRSERRELADQAAVEFLEADLRQALGEVADPELEQLAQARSAAVQGALLRGGELEESRVFIVRADRVKAEEGRVRLQLELK